MESDSNQEFWKEIEADVEDRIPEVIKIVLQKCGYSSRLSLCGVTSDDITAIEKFATENFKHELKRFLKSQPEYSDMKLNNDESFKFLPGHRRIIVQIGSIVAASRADDTCVSKGGKNATETVADEESIQLKEELCANILKWARNKANDVEVIFFQHF